MDALSSFHGVDIDHPPAHGPMYNTGLSKFHISPIYPDKIGFIFNESAINWTDKGYLSEKSFDIYRRNMAVPAWTN